MIFRQALIGCGSGVLLALLALLLTVPRATMEPKLRAAPDVARESAEGGVLVASLAGASGPHAASSLGAEVEPADPSLVALEAVLDAVPTPSSDDLDPDSLLGALSKQTVIRSEPDPKARVLGFARAGALLIRAKVPAGHKGCADGWYRVEPEGYVCVGKAATLDPEHPIIRLASVQPDRSLPMPYPYGQSRYPTPPLYTRIPTLAQQQIAEQDLAYHLRKNFGSLWEEQADTPPPSMLEKGAQIPRPYGYLPVEHDFMAGRAVASSAFAFMDLFEAEGRRFGLTTDFALLPLDRLTPVEVSDFAGVVLDEEHPLPVAFVRSRVQHVYEGQVEDGSFRPVRKAEYREAFHLTGAQIKVDGSVFLATRSGQYIKQHSQLVTLSLPEKMPKWAKDARSWIDVSILQQSLVAYRGQSPVFATLVSTGRDGLGDPENTHSTERGVFLIHTKHVTSTMSGSEADDEFDLRDVPYVQYFHGGYAFHAAFWHDGFGQPRSHGCVNLSPSDARHLFSLTDPPVPLRWHSALDRAGTLVYIHP